MTISDELLMAYADDELDPIERARVEAAVTSDDQLQKRVAAHRALRATLERAFAPVLEEPVPERLLTALRQAERPPTASVIELDAVRRLAARAAHAPTSAPWRSWSIAASLVVALGVGFLAWRHGDSGMILDQDGTRIARGALDHGLSNQLAGDQSPASGVTIGVSFMAKSGEYCRTFTVSAGAPSAGLACRHAARWEIRLLIPTAPADSRSPDYRTASSPLPAAILSAVEAQITGEPLAREAEIAARQTGWQTLRR